MCSQRCRSAAVRPSVWVSSARRRSGSRSTSSRARDQFDREACPQLRPRRHVLAQKLVERASAIQPSGGGGPCVADGAVSGGGDRHRLLGHDGLPRGHLDRELAADPARLHDHGTFPGQPRAVPEQPCPRRLGDADMRLGGLHHQQHAVRRRAARLDRRQVTAGQLPVPRHTAVGDQAVEPGTDAQPPGPLRHDRHLQSGQVRGSHVHEPAMRDPRKVAEIVANHAAPGQHPAAQVEFLAVLEHLDVFGAQPGPVFGREAQAKPVRRVHQALIFRGAPGDHRLQPVEAPGDIGTRVVHPIRPRLRRRPRVAK